MTAVPAAAVPVGVWSAAAGRAEDLCRLLAGAGPTVPLAPRPFQGEELPAELRAAPLVVIDDADARREALALCGRLRQTGGRRAGLVVVTSAAAPEARLATLQAGADAYLLRPFVPEELTALAARVLHERGLAQRLAEKSAEVLHVNRRLRQAYEQREADRELAGRVQRSLRPDPLPRRPGVRFAVRQQTAGRTGGDFCDVFALGPDRVGLFVADTVGHGLSAGLVGLYVCRGLHPRAEPAERYNPGEVLERLNRDLLAEALPEQPFVSACCGVYDLRGRTFAWARAGSPLPLVLPREGEPEFLAAEGNLLGVFEGRYETYERTLHAGDKVVLASDGLEALAVGGQAPGREGILAWAGAHGGLALEAMLDRLIHDLGDVPDGAGPPDDVTVLGLEVGQET